jgi:hypothetical protein
MPNHIASKKLSKKTLIIGAVAIFGGLYLIGTILGGGEEQVEEPPAQQEQAQQEQAQQEQAAKPAPKPETASLYERAAATEPPPYEIHYTAMQTAKRYDVYVVTERITDKAKLGALLVELETRSGSDLVTAYYCEEPGEAGCAETAFAVGQLAQTDSGREFMGAGAGPVPYMRVQF